jgi:hypothetical protein
VSNVESSRAADAGAPPWTSATWTARIHASALGGARETVSLRSRRSDQAVSPDSDSGFPSRSLGRSVGYETWVRLGGSASCGSTAYVPWLSRALPHVSIQTASAARYCDTAMAARGWAAPTLLRSHGPLATGEEPEERRRRRRRTRRLANLPSATWPLSLAASPGRHPQWGPRHPPAQLAQRAPGEPGGFSTGQHSPGVPPLPVRLDLPGGAVAGRWALQPRRPFECQMKAGPPAGRGRVMVQAPSRSR